MSTSAETNTSLAGWGSWPAGTTGVGPPATRGLHGSTRPPTPEDLTPTSSFLCQSPFENSKHMFVQIRRRPYRLRAGVVDRRAPPEWAHRLHGDYMAAQGRQLPRTLRLPFSFFLKVLWVRTPPGGEPDPYFRPGLLGRARAINPKPVSNQR